MVRLTENPPEEANRKWPMANRMDTLPMTSCDLDHTVKLMTPKYFRVNISETVRDTGLVSVAHIYRVGQKTKPHTFIHIFAKY